MSPPPPRSPAPQLGSRAAKDALFEGFARIGAAMGNGRRAELLEVLTQGERTVEQLAHEVAQSVANTSHHLRVLARAGLVATRREGTHVHYRLADTEVEEAWLTLRRLAERQLPGFDTLARGYLGEREAVPTIDRDELVAGLAEQRYLVVDVRPLAEHRAAHLPGAIPVPPDELTARLAALIDDREVIAYCRGPYCVYADDAVRWLIAQGRRARRFTDGLPEWRRAGGPVATAATGASMSSDGHAQLS